MFGMILASISQKDIENVVSPVTDLVKIVIPVMLSLVAAVGGIYCIVLGVKYAKAEDPQEHDKAKNALKNAIIGFVMIFLLLVMLQLGSTLFIQYYNNSISA